MRQIHYPDDMGSKFKFIAVAALRCRQLQKGARTRVASRSKKFTTIAQEEVLAGEVAHTDSSSGFAENAEASGVGSGEVGSAE